MVHEDAIVLTPKPKQRSLFQHVGTTEISVNTPDTCLCFSCCSKGTEPVSQFCVPGNILVLCSCVLPQGWRFVNCLQLFLQICLLRLLQGHVCKIDCSFLSGHIISQHHLSPSGLLISLFTCFSGHVMQMISCKLSWLQSDCVPPNTNFPLPRVYLEIIVLISFCKLCFGHEYSLQNFPYPPDSDGFSLNQARIKRNSLQTLFSGFW